MGQPDGVAFNVSLFALVRIRTADWPDIALWRDMEAAGWTWMRGISSTSSGELQESEQDCAAKPATGWLLN
jgi:hypothetical protein